MDAHGVPSHATSYSLSPSIAQEPQQSELFSCGLEIVSLSVNEYNRKEESYKSISRGKGLRMSDLDHPITKEAGPTPRNHGLLM